MFIVTMGILKMPYAMLMGVVIAITALIPVFGAFIGCFIGIIMIGIVNPIQAIEFIVLFLVLQQIEGNFIYPHVVGNSVGLPSIWGFVAVIIGGNLMGIMGMFLFIPLTSIFYTLFKTYVKDQLKKYILDVFPLFSLFLGIFSMSSSSTSIFICFLTVLSESPVSLTIVLTDGKQDHVFLFAYRSNAL